MGRLLQRRRRAGSLENEDFWAYADKPQATRNLSGIMINRLKDLVPQLIGGSADLAPSNKTYMDDAGDFSKGNYGGRNLHSASANWLWAA